MLAPASSSIFPPPQRPRQTFRFYYNNYYLFPFCSVCLGLPFRFWSSPPHLPCSPLSLAVVLPFPFKKTKILYGGRVFLLPTPPPRHDLGILGVPLSCVSPSHQDWIGVAPGARFLLARQDPDHLSVSVSLSLQPSLSPFFSESGNASLYPTHPCMRRKLPFLPATGTRPLLLNLPAVSLPIYFPFSHGSILPSQPLHFS